MVEEPESLPPSSESNGGANNADESSPIDADKDTAATGLEPAETSAEVGVSHENPASSIDDEELPDWEELTPELFEDECIRGDFMLRWAAILLALLLGWTYLTESQILVQIKTGQEIASNGFLPPRTDSFSVAAEGHSWVNLHWLADLTIGLVEGIGGFTALSILTALKLGVSFWFLSHIGYKKVSTWWASICAVIAIVAIFPAVQPGEMSVTILGFSVLMFLLFRWREKPESTSYWELPVLFFIWSNCDPRAWTGLLFFLVFFITDLVMKSATKRQLTIGVSALAAGLFLHPWPLQPAFGFQETLANASQAQLEGLSGTLFSRYAYGMMAQEFWESPDIFAIAAGAMLALSFMALFLNANRFDWSLTTGWIAMNGLTFYFGELIPYAAIVNCVVATLQGQDWYRNRFEMSYSIDWFPVFIARAGRAVTVLSFFLVAYAAINGFLMGPQSRRIGMGLDPRLQNSLTSIEEDLLDGIYGDRVFNVRADQGDMLIWLGKKPYLDSRNGLFVNAQTDFTKKHLAIRSSIFSTGQPEPGQETDTEVVSWEEEFEKDEMQSLILRLWGDTPAYRPFLMLIGSRVWSLSSFGAAGAVFSRGDLNDPDLSRHIEEHNSTRFYEQAFKLNEKNTVSESIQNWPRSVSNYDQWLVQELKVTPNTIQLARHYDELAKRLQNNLAIEQGIALGVLSMRSAREGLIENPNDPDAYRILTDAQALLDQSERVFMQANGGDYTLQLRTQQMLCQAFHTARASGNAPEDLKRLFVILLGQQNLDTAGFIADQYFEITGKPITQEEGDDEATSEKANEVLDQISELVTQIEKEVATAREKSSSLPQLVGIAMNGRCQKMALSLLEEDKTVLAKNPALQLRYANLLLGNGRTEDAWQQLEGMQTTVDQIGTQNPVFLSQWRNSTAIANLMANDLSRAANLWAEDAEAQNKQNVRALLVQPPMSSAPIPTMDIWSAITLRTHANALVNFPERWATAKLQEALVRIDQGNLEAAKNALSAILDGHPEFSMRSLVVFYLTLITGEKYEMEPPSSWIPIWGDMFAPDEEEESQSTEPAPPIKTPANTKTSPGQPPSPSLPERPKSDQ